MSSSNKVRRYLQNHKYNSNESNKSQTSTANLLSTDSLVLKTTMRKFRSKTSQQQISIPQICVNNNDDEHISILNQFDEILDNELKHTPVIRTSSLKQNDINDQHIDIPIHQPRSFSFALGSTDMSDQEHVLNEINQQSIDILPLKSTKLSTLSKETFSRLFNSLTFRSTSQSTTKITMARTDSQQSCSECQNHSNYILLPKQKKRPSIFDVLVSKLNSSIVTNDDINQRCTLCKRILKKSISNNVDNSQLTSSTLKQCSNDQIQSSIYVKRRQSLPSLFQNLFDGSNSQISPKRTSISSQSTISLSEFDVTLNENNSSFKRSPVNSDDLSQLTEKYEIKTDNDHGIIHDELHDLNTMKSFNENDTNQQFLHPPEEKPRSLLGNVFRTRRTNLDMGTNEKNMVGKYFSASVINLASSIGSNRRNSAIGTIQELVNDQRKQHALSDENLTSLDNMHIYFMNINGENFKEKLKLSKTCENTTLREMLTKIFEKHHLSIETCNICLRSTPTVQLSLDQLVKHLLLDDLVVTGRVISSKMANDEKDEFYRLSIRQHLSDVLKSKRKSFHMTNQDYLLSSSTTTFPFAWNCTLNESKKNVLNDDLKHLTGSFASACLVKQKSVSYDDLSLTLTNNSKQDELRTNTMNYKLKHNEAAIRISTKSSGKKERNAKRNSISSVILPSNSKPSSKRLSTHCMMLDNDENQDLKVQNRTNKTHRSSLFSNSLFNRESNDSTDRTETNQTFIRRKCDEWLINGLPKLSHLQSSIDDCDLNIEKEWQQFLNDQSRTIMSETIKLQQEGVYEMLSTEVSYIRQILTMTDIFMTSIHILKSSQRDGLFHDIDMEKLFSNIKDVLNGNLLFWKEILLPIKCKLEQTGEPMNPSDLKHGFMKFDVYFKPYLKYVLDQKTSGEYFKQKLSRDEFFQYLITWIEANFTNRLSFSDLTIKPLQRLTRYKLLLEAIQKKTIDIQQKNDLHDMIQHVATFVNEINSNLHDQEQEELVRQINDRIGPYENISAPPELTSIIQEYNRDTVPNRLDLLQDMPLFVRGYRRQIIQQGPMRMKDSKNSQDVYCYLFTDMFLITKNGKRLTSTNSSINNDGPTNRTMSNLSNKILKLPIRIDRIDVREYERRNNNTEPNTASFVAIVFSEYNLIECGYLFQTNLSKQWIENIRSTKANFQLLLEQSKIKFQEEYRMEQALCSSVSTNTNLSTISFETSNENAERSSKIESNVFKIVEQTRRNSRTDRKNYGRYFTADGTSTHTTSSPIKNISSSSSTAIIKRMSWNNEQIMEKNDSSLITNSFRSVHSSSGVSSTGSFLFSTDDDSSIITTTTSSIPSKKHDEYDGKSSASTVIDTNNQPSSLLLFQDTHSIIEDANENRNTTMTNNEHITFNLSSPESSLRRTPYPSVKKRNQNSSRRNKLFNDQNKSHTNGNESDYDNNQTINSMKPVKHLQNSSLLIKSDNLLSTDENMNVNNKQQSDIVDIPLINKTPHRANLITSVNPTATVDECLPSSFIVFRRDPITTRRLLDIRSHLLLNTTLDATEV